MDGIAEGSVGASDAPVLPKMFFPTGDAEALFKQTGLSARSLSFQPRGATVIIPQPPDKMVRVYAEICGQLRNEARTLAAEETEFRKLRLPSRSIHMTSRIDPSTPTRISADHKCIMNDETRLRIEETVRHLVELMVEGRYETIEALTKGVRYKREEVELAVLEYGRRLTTPPDGSYRLIDVVPISKTSPPEYSIRFRLYTEEEGRSDFEIQATLIDADDDTRLMNVELDAILVA